MASRKTINRMIYDSLSTKTKMKLLKANVAILTNAAVKDIAHSKKKMAITGLVVVGLVAAVWALSKND